MSTEAQIGAAKGIEPCPMCASADVRWRRRRPTDFVFTWARWTYEMIASGNGSQARRDLAMRESSLGGDTSLARSEMQNEVRESNTGHRTPKRFWKCSACRNKGYVF